MYAYFKTCAPVVWGLTVLFLFTSISCAKIESDPKLDSSSNTISDGFNAQKEFSIILSKAAHENRDLRVFLRDEALKQFDYDYDVFYPYTKDKLVGNSKTFREVLLGYCESESQLEKIENALPLLNILLPDMAWIDSDLFSAETWNVDDDDVMVTFREGNRNQEFYENGCLSFNLEGNELPCGPILVVKNNERMQFNPSTKSCGSGNYEFCEEEFDNTKPSTKAASWTHDTIYYDVEDTTDYAPLLRVYAYSPLGSEAAISDNVPKNTPGALRDYCYYGMSKSNPVGKLNTTVKEGLFRIKFNSVTDIKAVCDDIGGGDPCYETHNSYTSSNSGVDEGFFGLMCEGSLELYIDYYYGVINSNTIKRNKKLVLNPKDILQVKSVEKGFQHKTMFNKRHWTYDIKFATKWYYPKTKMDFFNWNLSENSTTLSLHVWEKDAKVTRKDKKSYTWSYSSSSNFGFDVDILSVIKLNFGVGDEVKSNVTQEVEYTVTEEDDDLSWVDISYNDPYITDVVMVGGRVSSYRLCSYSTGAVSISLIPYKL